jgi:hypothetical protein
VSRRGRLDKPPRGAKIQLSSEQLRLGGLVIGGAIAAFALPRLITLGRRSMRTIGGTTYRTGKVGAPPAADPARGRPA